MASCASISARISLSFRLTSMRALLRMISSRLATWRSSCSATSCSFWARKAANSASISTSRSRLVSCLIKSRFVSWAIRSFRILASISAMIWRSAACWRAAYSDSICETHSSFFSPYWTSSCSRRSSSRSCLNWLKCCVISASRSV